MRTSAVTIRSNRLAPCKGAVGHSSLVGAKARPGWPMRSCGQTHARVLNNNKVTVGTRQAQASNASHRSFDGAMRECSWAVAALACPASACTRPHLQIAVVVDKKVHQQLPILAHRLDAAQHHRLVGNVHRGSGGTASCACKGGGRYKAGGE